MVGQNFGRLTVLRRVGTKWKNPLWECRCECGKLVEVPSVNLRRNNTRSCGCMKFKANGDWGTKEYKAWDSMVRRCGPESSARRNYYDRGISVCTEWANSYMTFLNDMGRAPSPKHSLDRINNDLGYFPGNVRWATAKEQARNRRISLTVEFHGEVLCLAEVLERLGLSHKYHIVRQRILRDGWAVEEALKF